MNNETALISLVALCKKFVPANMQADFIRQGIDYTNMAEAVMMAIVSDFDALIAKGYDDWDLVHTHFMLNQEMLEVNLLTMGAPESAEIMFDLSKRSFNLLQRMCKACEFVVRFQVMKMFLEVMCSKERPASPYLFLVCLREKFFQFYNVRSKELAAFRKVMEEHMQDGLTFALDISDLPKVMQRYTELLKQEPDRVAH